MFYKNCLIYLHSNVDTSNDLIAINHISNYKYLPIIYKIVEKYYPKQVCGRVNTNKFSSIRWNNLLNQAKLKEDNYSKGIALENIADYFIKCTRGLKVTGRRVKLENEEIDLVCCNVSKNSYLWELGTLILVECKNWKEKVDTKVIRNLVYQIDKKGINTILLFTRNGVTKGAKLEVARQTSQNRFIIVFDLNELYKIDGENFSTTDFINLKLDEIMESLYNKEEILSYI